MINQYGEEQDDILGAVDMDTVQDQALQQEIADEAAILPVEEPVQESMPVTAVPALIPQIQPSDLDQAQDQRNKLQQFGMLMKAFQGFSNIPRQMINPNAKADTSLQDQVIELANQPVSDVTNRRTIAAADQRLASANVDLQNKMLDNDPTSDQSRSYQELMLKMIPSFDQERLSKMSARQIEAVMSPIARWQQFKDMALVRRMNRQDAEEERKTQAEIRNEQKEKEIALKAEKQLEDNIQKLSNKIGNTQDLISSLGEVEKQLGFSLDDAEVKSNELYAKGKKRDLPGASIPGLGRVNIYSGDARQLQSTIARVFNVELKDRSGAAVTNPEMDRMREEFNSGKYNTEAEMVSALKRYKQSVIKELKNREAGFKPEVIKEYSDRGGFTSKSLSSDKEMVSKDPKIEKYAQDNNLSYEKAESILKARGYRGQ